MSPSEDPVRLASLIRWLEVESPTTHRDGVNAMMDLVMAEVAGLPVAVERIPGRDGLGDHLALRAGPATGAGSILLLSHLDTVHPLGTLGDALPVRRDGDRLFGPGALDMKGGAYFALQAFRAVAAAGTAKRPLVYLFTADEEIGSPTSRAPIECEARGASFCLVTEAARDGGRIVTARKGVGRFEVRVEGKPSHSGARHQDGVSAIREAAKHILAIEAMTDYARGVTTTVGLVTGGTAPNVTPQHARFTVDLRVESADDGAVYEAAILGLRAHDPGARVTVAGGMNRPAYRKSPRIAALHDHARACAREIGYGLDDVPMTGGGSDGNFAAALGVPTLDGLGVDGEGAHTLHEHALVSSFDRCERLMAQLLETL